MRYVQRMDKWQILIYYVHFITKQIQDDDDDDDEDDDDDVDESGQWRYLWYEWWENRKKRKISSFPYVTILCALGQHLSTVSTSY